MVEWFGPCLFVTSWGLSINVTSPTSPVSHTAVFSVCTRNFAVFAKFCARVSVVIFIRSLAGAHYFLDLFKVASLLIAFMAKTGEESFNWTEKAVGIF